MSSEFKWDIDNIDEAIAYTVEEIGHDFERTVNLVNDIIEDPQKYSGVVASQAAMKLSAYRMRIGTAQEYFKLKTPQTQKPHDKLRKNALCCLYNSLEEVILTLKLRARLEKELMNGYS